MFAATSKEWTCPTCFKPFGRKGDLTRHQLLHIGYKPHKCSECGKAFSQASGLKTHFNIHTRSKPFRCGINSCQAAFGDPSSCTRHRKETHDRVEAYQCPFPRCKSSIKRRSAFAAHLRKHDLKPHEVSVYIKTSTFRTKSSSVARDSRRALNSRIRVPPPSLATKVSPDLMGHQPVYDQQHLPTQSYGSVAELYDDKSNLLSSYNSPASYIDSYIDFDGLFTLDSDPSSSPSVPPPLTFSVSPSPAPSLDNELPEVSSHFLAHPKPDKYMNWPSSLSSTSTISFPESLSSSAPFAPESHFSYQDPEWMHNSFLYGSSI